MFRSRFPLHFSLYDCESVTLNSIHLQIVVSGKGNFGEINGSSIVTWPVGRKIYIVLYPNISTAYCRYPVPADRCMERRIISTEFTAVYIMAFKFRLFFNKSGSIIFIDVNRYCIFFSRELRISVTSNLSSCKSSFNPSKFLSVEIYFRFPVYTVEVEKYSFPR